MPAKLEPHGQFTNGRDQDAAAVGRALLKVIGRKSRRASAIRSLLLAELRSEPDLERLFAEDEAVLLDCS